MDTLPTELIAHLCLFLDRSSLKTFRLLCKVFAALAEEHLFHDFEFRLYPNSHRLYQFEQLAANKSISSRLKCISFESGVQLEYADYRYWQAQVYNDISSAWARSVASRGSSKDEYAKFHESLQARFTANMSTRYDLYRWHLDQQAALMAHQRVRDALRRAMDILSTSCSDLQFKMVMAEPQIQLEELEAFHPEEYANEQPYDPDPRRRVFNRRKHCKDQFLHFLDAAQLSQCQVTNLTAVDMPHEMLTVQHDNGEPALEDIFSQLKKLDLKISSLPHSDWLSRSGNSTIYVNGRNQAAWRLKMLLNRPSQLEELSLELPQGKEAEYSFDLFDRTNIDRFPRLWMPHLKSLTLCRFRCRWGDLKALLQEGVHIDTLILKNCRMESCSMIDLLLYLAGRHLPSASILGTWLVDEDGGSWHSHTEEDFTTCFAATSYEGPYARTGLKSKIERYIHTGGDCPLPAWTPSNSAEAAWELAGDTSFHYLPGPLEEA